MSKEIPDADPPLSAEEQAVVDQLGATDLQFIDDTILSNSAECWRKVARVAGLAQDALASRYSGLPCVFYALRISRLVDAGRLDSQGDLSYMRFSEVRLRPSKFNEP
jgi:hypothetical protein